MAKKAKTKAWVKGLIAVAVIAVIGGLGYYGANGEMFQGKLKLDRSNFDKVRQTNDFDKVRQTNDFDKVRMDRVNRVAQPIEIEKLAVDGVDDALVKQLADQSYDKVAIGKVKYDVLDMDTFDLTVGDQDIDLLDIEIGNMDKVKMLVTDLVIYEDGGGLYNYEVFVDGVKIDAAVRIKTVFIEKLGKEVREITFDFDSPFAIDGLNVETFKVKADVAGGKDFVSHAFDKVMIDGDIELVNMDFDLDSVARDIGKLK